jgi:hypothetical protein
MSARPGVPGVVERMREVLIARQTLLSALPPSAGDSEQLAALDRQLTELMGQIKSLAPAKGPPLFGSEDRVLDGAREASG